MLQEAIKNFRQPVYTKTARSVHTYASIKDRCATQITRLVEEYNSVKNDQQLLREIRNEIDYQLRRYHNYAIKENIGAHYIEVGLEGNGIFEHMIPASTVRDLCIAGVFTAEQALNVPTCRLSKQRDDTLREKGWVKNTPDIYNFWERYKYCFDTEGVFTTWDGQSVDTDMTLDDHFAQFVVDTDAQ